MKYNNVKFHWFEPADDRNGELYERTELRGVVLVRDRNAREEIVLDIHLTAVPLSATLNR